MDKTKQVREEKLYCAKESAVLKYPMLQVSCWSSLLYTLFQEPLNCYGKILDEERMSLAVDLRVVVFFQVERLRRELFWKG